MLTYQPTFPLKLVGSYSGLSFKVKRNSMSTMKASFVGKIRTIISSQHWIISNFVSIIVTVSLRSSSTTQFYTLVFIHQHFPSFAASFNRMPSMVPEGNYHTIASSRKCVDVFKPQPTNSATAKQHISGRPLTQVGTTPRPD